MFEYFGENYSWDLAVLMAMQLGGHPSEIDEACRPLRALAAAPDAKTNTTIQVAWLEAWLALAKKLESKADQDVSENHRLSAAGK